MTTKRKTIFRPVVDDKYVILSNAMLRDSRLSFRARGILAMIMTNKSEWEVTKAWLESQGTEGREAITSALKELKEYGYATFTFEKDELKRFAAGVWSFYGDPITPKNGKPQGLAPQCGKPSMGKPATKKEHPPEVPSQEGTSLEGVSSLRSETDAEPFDGCPTCTQVWLGDEHQEDGTAEPIDPKSNPLAGLQSKPAPLQKPAAPPKSDTKSPPLMFTLMAEGKFIAAFKRRFGINPDIDFGRDRKALKSFFGRHPDLDTKVWISFVQAAWDGRNTYLAGRCKTISGAVAVWNDIATLKPVLPAEPNIGPDGQEQW